MFRNYIVNPSLSTNGQPIGGLKGFLQSLQKLIRETKPDQVLICWDGEGGSQRRKSKNKGYKCYLKLIVRKMKENKAMGVKILNKNTDIPIIYIY